MKTVTPQPGFTEADVISALGRDSLRFADCFTFTPKTGPALRYTNYQRNLRVVPIGGVSVVTYLSSTVGIKGLRVKASRGPEVDEQEINLDYRNSPDFQGSMSWAQALLHGKIDGSRISRDRFVANGEGVWVGGFPMFSGLVSSLNSVGRQSATIKVKSDLVLLDVQMPRDLWEPNCKNTWGDTACGVNQEDFAVTASAGASTTRSFIDWTGSSDNYDLGKINITGPDGNIRVRTISEADTTGLYLSYPLDFDPAPGSSFKAYPGCNRTKDRCPFFHGPTEWVKRFKGFPFIPVAETALG